MGKNFIKLTSLCLAVVIFTFCHSTKIVSNEIEVDPVCGMKVKKTESYDLKLNHKRYYFDSFDCREAFKNNPDYFLEKKCTSNPDIIDMVCGVKVDLSESYDLKFEGKVYHFHSYECKEAFKMNPKKFLDNKCPAQNVSVKQNAGK